MHNRRNFLLQGGLAAAAILAAKPSAATHKLQSWFPQLGVDKSYLTIVHGTHLPDLAMASFITANKAKNHVLLVQPQPPYRTDDNVLLQQQDVATGIHYLVVKKGRQKVGVVHAPAALTTVAVQAVDAIAKQLKQQHHCQLVVCAWQANAHSFTAKRPEMEIAKNIKYIDVFAGAKAPATRHYPVIATNQLGHEVVFQYHTDGGLHSSLQIGFDASGHRNHIAFEPHVG